MTEFIIEKNIPVPAARSGNGSYPFHSMEVGDSFAVVRERKTRVGSAAFAYGKKHGKKFVIRKVSGDLFRLWRTQ
jgi:hypothetical protein